MTDPFPIMRNYTTPNVSPRRDHGIACLVIHATVGSLDSSVGWLCNPNGGASSDFVIAKTGDIYLLNANLDTLFTWHAGVSQWNDLAVWAKNKKGELIPSLNPVSIGIELENLTGMRRKDGSIQPQELYPPAQVAALTWLARRLIAQYAIDLANVVRHLDVALPKGRKRDPAGFAWEEWMAGVAPMGHGP